jgi:hypothetical protein
MARKTNMAKRGNDDEAPKMKDIIIVLLIAALLVTLSYIGWYKFGWFH